MRWRLLAMFLSVIGLMLLAQDVPLAGHLRNVERDRLLAGLERDAFLIAASAETALDSSPPDVGSLDSTIRIYHERANAMVLVTDATGLRVAGDDPVGEDYASRPEIVDALARQPQSGQRESPALGYEVVYVAVPVLSGADVVGAVRITAAASSIDDRARSKVRGLYFVGLVSLIGGAIAALFMSYSVTRPLRRLQRTTELVAAGDFSSQADTGAGPPEVRNLAVAFNSMTGRVARLVDQQRHFVADVSHQLRTPLTALRLQLERGADLVDTDPRAAQHALEAAGAETERLQHLVEALLLLARAEAGPLQTEVVDIAAVAAERVAIWAPFADDREVTIALHGPAHAPALAAPGAVEQILDNYLDNALNVVPSGTSIDVDVAAIDGHVDVHVRDRGPGMSNDQLDRAFDRFWRAPEAPHDGTGLGLAIVSHLAAASGGEAHLAPREGGGLDASLRLTRV